MGEIGDHHRDIRNHKRRQRTARRQRRREDKHAQKPDSNGHSNGHNSGKEHDGDSKASGAHRRCWDWMLVGGTSHYAKNRSSFSTYCRAPCQIGTTRVLGVGTVKLETVRSPQDQRTHILELDNVLHIPEALCNGISINPEFMVEHGLQISFRESLVYKEDTKEPFFYGRKYCGLPRIVLAGDPHGETYLEEGTAYSLSIYAGDDQLQELARRVGGKI